MSDYQSKPWMQPTRYTDEMGVGASQGRGERTQADIDAILAGERVEREGYGGGGRPVELRDTAPMDYNNKGSRDRDLDLDEREYDSEHVEYVPKPKTQPGPVEQTPGVPQLPLRDAKHFAPPDKMDPRKPFVPPDAIQNTKTLECLNPAYSGEFRDMTFAQLTERLQLTQRELDATKLELDELRWKSYAEIGGCKEEPTVSQPIEIKFGNKTLIIKSH